VARQRISTFVGIAAAAALHALGCAPGGPRGATGSSAGPDAGATPPSVIPLWSEGAPGSEARRHEPEEARDWWVKNVHDPSVTVFVPPPGRSNGTAVVIAPGGGHRELVFNAEGVEPARYLAALGVTAFALKYRLAHEEGSTYDLDRDAGADIRRAMRLVRSRAA
jgi:acetyl esterase/lipase